MSDKPFSLTPTPDFDWGSRDVTLEEFARRVKGRQVEEGVWDLRVYASTGEGPLETIIRHYFGEMKLSAAVSYVKRVLDRKPGISGKPARAHEFGVAMMRDRLNRESGKPVSKSAAMAAYARQEGMSAKSVKAAIAKAARWWKTEEGRQLAEKLAGRVKKVQQVARKGSRANRMTTR